MNHARLMPVTIDDVAMSESEVIAIGFDARVLRITVEFRGTRDWVYVDFRFPRGFRVLDEGDLLEFWGGDRAPGSVLFQVESGGWLDLESQRPGFASTQRESVTEFLVATNTTCVNVLAIEPPQVSVCK
jgi:hypothetical protein